MKTRFFFILGGGEEQRRPVVNRYPGDNRSEFNRRSLNHKDRIFRGATSQISFQIAFESNYAIAIAIATLSHWLKDLAPIFQPMRSKTETSGTLCPRFLLRFEQITGNY